MAPEAVPFGMTVLIARPSAAKHVMPSTRVSGRLTTAAVRGETSKAIRPSTIVMTAMRNEVASTLVRWPAR